MSDIIIAKNLSKDFNDVKAVDDLSFTVPTGKVYGFLGQNGAGKSTTIRMLLTLIAPTSGEIEIFGMSLEKHRKEILSRVGAIIEKPDMYKYLTALENMKIFAVMSGVKLSEKQLLEQLDKVGLVERAKSKVKTFSQGMKQRLGIAVALLHNPDLIVLDEPMNGLDPQGIADIRNLILHLSRDLGKTVFISSHLLTEMEVVADAMLIIDKGKKVVEGKVAELLNPKQIDVEVETTDNAKASQLINHSSWGRYWRTEKDGKIIVKIDKHQVPAFIRELSDMPMDILSIRPRHTLEDYFLSLTAHSHVSSLTN